LGLADAHFLAGNFGAAVEVAQNALSMHPMHWALQRCLAKALTAVGDFDRALKILQRAMVGNAGPQAQLGADIAYLHAVTGRMNRSAKFLVQAESVSSVSAMSPLDVAKIHVALGNKDQALDYLEDACARRDWCVLDFKQDSRLDSLRATPRFRNLLARVGL
jgi:tetratricopeptide (TPR) repeat protein